MPQSARNKRPQTRRLTPPSSVLASKRVENQHQIGSSRLESLPNELLQHIGGQLTYSSQAALALCSKTMMSKLGDKVIKRLNCTAPEVFAWQHSKHIKGINLEFRASRCQEERLKLVKLLHRDLCRNTPAAAMPVCLFCQTLHKREEYIVWPSYSDKSENSNRGAALAYALPFSFIQNSLKQWAKTPLAHSAEIQDSIAEFLSTKCAFERRDAHSVYTRNQAGYVVDGNFYLRTQHLVSLPGKESTSEPPALCSHIKLCSTTHCAALLRARDAKLRERVRCRLRHAVKKEAPCAVCDAVQGCRECNTDSQVGVVEREGGMWVSVTTWEAFVEGESPFESKFRKRDGVGEVNYDVRFAPGGVKEVFDEADGVGSTTS